jgi:hypothetical protein
VSSLRQLAAEQEKGVGLMSRDLNAQFQERIIAFIFIQTTKGTIYKIVSKVVV